jgi:hypothetical protein
MTADKVNVKAFCFIEEKFGNLCFHYIHGSQPNQQCGADVTVTLKFIWLPVGITDDRKLVSMKLIVF